MNCEICGKEIKKTFSLNINRVFHCGNCNHYFCGVIVKNGEYRVYEKYEYLLKPLRDKNFDKILKNLSGLLPPNAVGLEVGSALGWFLQKCARIGYSMTGIEPIKCNYEKSLGGGYDVINGYFPECLPTEKYESKYDFIIFNDVFEHIPDAIKTLGACKVLLKQDGYLIINLPISSGVIFKTASLLAKLERSKPLIRLWQFETESPHLHYFSGKSLRKLAKTLGFSTSIEFYMDTVDSNFNNTYKRIKGIGDSAKFYTLIIALITFVGTPLWKVLPKDTKCFIFKNRKGNN
jgi:SAM-dependent methyltransferase